MLQRSTAYISIITLLISCVCVWTYDPVICPRGTTTYRDPTWTLVPSRFEVISEVSSGNMLIEVAQAFASKRDSILLSVPGKSAVQFYWSFLTNEKFTVAQTADASGAAQKRVCNAENITTASVNSLFIDKEIVVKPSILLGYDAKNEPNQNWGVNYVGTDTIRGLPVRVFSSCFMVDDFGATVNATYYVLNTNPTVFNPFGRGNVSSILQIDVIIKAGNLQDSYQYHIYGYRPNPSPREERQALETPEGVYCANRQSTLRVPGNLPSRVSANSEVNVPFFNRTIFSTHRLFDTEFEFTRTDAWYLDPSNGSRMHYTEIHDFATGLSYRYNNVNRQCSVGNITLDGNDAELIDGEPNLLQIGNPQHFFLLDDMEYQYTGEKRCRDRVRCHVWIGEKFNNQTNVTEHREWYWATTVNDEPLPQWIPTKFVLKQYVGIYLVNLIEISIFDFNRQPFTIFEIDRTLSECYRSLGPSKNFNIGVYSFKINNERKYPVFSNLNYLRFHIWETLSFAMLIRPIRISNLIVDADGDDILVTFTLLDAPPTTGPVEILFKEKSLDVLTERLETAINSNDLAFRARYDSKQVVLRARPDSLNVLHRSSKAVTLTSGPRITGLWLGLIITGIVVGSIGTFFLCAVMTKK